MVNCVRPAGNVVYFYCRCTLRYFYFRNTMVNRRRYDCTGFIYSFTVWCNIGCRLINCVWPNLIDIAESTRQTPVPLWWNLLHQPGFKPLGGGHNLFIFYPFLPWAGVMLLGYCCGKLFTAMDAPKRSSVLLYTGIGAVILFIIIRFINIYGDPRPWQPQATGLKTFFSFMNVLKYPPSLLFICATIGPLLIALSFIKTAGSRFAKMVSVIGRMPLFYFAVHFFILHLAQIIMYLLNGHSVADGLKGVEGQLFKFVAPGQGFSLGVVYIIWITVVIIMYPLCKWYDGYKTQHKEKWWLSYL